MKLSFRIATIRCVIFRSIFHAMYLCINDMKFFFNINKHITISSLIKMKLSFRIATIRCVIFRYIFQAMYLCINDMKFMVLFFREGG